MKKVAFHNLGCKVNAYETEAMLQQLSGKGYEIVPFEPGADIYVINTCTVTNVADRKSRQMLHRARKMNPDAVVVAVGCYVQADQEGVQADEAVDLVIGNDQKGRLAELLEVHASAVTEIGQVTEFESLGLTSGAEHTRAFLKVQDGCNQFCSYCLIPYVRGRVRSRKAEEVLQEAGRLAEKGYREIVLTGIHLSSYGMDFSGAPMGGPLQDLILRLAEVPGIMRIRLGSLEPRIITEEFVQAMAACEKFCPHFHLSLQSGCDETLKRMNRRYTIREYYEKCIVLRRAFSHPAITTDVIVGFPGETEEEFEETCRFLEEVNLAEMHIFKYSKRKGTQAASMPAQVPELIKTVRSNRLLEMNERHVAAFRRCFDGQEQEILLEEPVVRENKTFFTGYTREYVKVCVAADGHQPGDLVYKIIRI